MRKNRSSVLCRCFVEPKSAQNASDKMALTVYITRKIPQEGMNILGAHNMKVRCWNDEDVVSRDELKKQVAGVHGILCTVSDQIDKEILDAAGPQLKAISTLSVGTANIDIGECKKRNIEVACVADVASDSAAEFTVALVLVVARRLLEGMDAVIKGEWGLWKPMWICGFEMGGRTLGIYGFGRVGFGVARRLKAFNIKNIIYYDVAEQSYAQTVEATKVDFDTLLMESDILCVCCAATPNTIKSLNKDAFAKMKDSAIVINTARGSIIDHDDLDKAMKEGRPMAAGLDVTDPEPLPKNHPLLKNPRCIITPHLGTSVWETRINMTKDAATNLHIMLLGRQD